LVVDDKLSDAMFKAESNLVGISPNLKDVEIAWEFDTNVTSEIIVLSHRNAISDRNRPIISVDSLSTEPIGYHDSHGSISVC
jgi:hypothetical protein